MIARLGQLIAARRRFVVYTVIGLSGVLLDYVLFLLLTRWVGLHHQLANAISTSAGIINNFILNAWLNFRVRDRLIRRFLGFYAVGLSGMGATALLLFLFVDLLQFSPALVKLGSLVVVLLLQYNLNRWLAFRRVVPEDAAT